MNITQKKTVFIQPTREIKDIKMIVLHHTGIGCIQKANQKGIDPVTHVNHLYQHCMKCSPHYMIDYDGNIYNYHNHINIAYHAGYGSAWKVKYYKFLYQKKFFNDKRFKWFHDTYPMKSPLDFESNLNFNKYSIGIELLTHPLSYTNQQMQSLCELVSFIKRAYDLVLDEMSFITHSVAHPYARTTKKGYPWDPPLNGFQIKELIKDINKIG